MKHSAWSTTTPWFLQKLQGFFRRAQTRFEGLYYSPAAILAVAEFVARIQGLNASDLVLLTNAEALRNLNSASIDHLASRVAERRMRDAVLASMPDRKQIVAGNQIEVRVDNPYPKERTKLQGFVNDSNLEDVIRNYPIKFSGVRNAIAQALHQATQEDYERTLLQQVSERLELRNQLRRELGVVAEALGAIEVAPVAVEQVAT